jgi:hypothetical protein
MTIPSQDREVNDLKKITLPVAEAARGSLVIETA